MTKRPAPGLDTPKKLPCDHCRSSKIRCDHAEPCANCISKSRECTYSTDDSGRQRKFHRRSKTGCLKCKSRRVRCDETRPICGACTRIGYPCDYSDGQDSPACPPDHSPSWAMSSTSPVPSFDFDTFFSSITNVANPSTSGANVNIPSANLPASPAVSSIRTTTLPIGTNSFDAAFFSLPSGALAANMTSAGDHARSQDVPAQRDSTHLFGSIPALSEIQAIFPDVDQLITTRSTSNTSSPALSLPHTPKETVNPYQLSLNQNNKSYLNNAATLGVAQDLIPFLNQTTMIPQYTFFAPLHQPDALLAYFPSPEQRQQYRHFYTETIQSLIVVPTPPSSNPWLTKLSSLALGSAFGHDPCHDALRYAILSLASLDIGFRIHHSLSNRIENVMYTTSYEQRKNALQLLALVQELDGWSAQPELVLGTCLALSFRDRLAGSHEWEAPLKIAAEVVTSNGGSGFFIALNPTPIRRYLVEQMACVEIIALLTTFNTPQILSWDNSWLDYGVSNEPNDHLHVVYGWERETVKVGGQMCMISDEYRRAELLKERNRAHGYKSVRDAMAVRLNDVKQKCIDHLAWSSRVRTHLHMMPVPAQVSVVSMALLACMEIFIQLIVLGSEKLAITEGQARVSALLEVTDEAMSRGMYAGLLMPLTWAAACAVGDNKAKAATLLELLAEKYHLEHVLLDRIVKFDWKSFDGVSFEDWEGFLRERDLFVPLF